ncbi:ABC transporter ATP-binding protein [Lacisediminihabitans profunda]|uniref:ABC transporter ATP-binding protein n=1 Tax=Lacisediminihabitans profunda TaxID=2594790 RepID=UPI00164EE8DB|nr:oligopeptide/dipeptide ABC transporter ATP-binding protein [Lacisediminihabitans profunda]
MNTRRPPLLSASGLSVTYGGSVTAVCEVDLEVAEGETLALVGESGCGKSTLGRALLRLEPASAGTITFAGTDISRLSRAGLRLARADMQMVFQDPMGSLNPRRSIGAIIAEPLRQTRGVSVADALRRARELLERVGLSASMADRRPHEFSGGQRQRIGIARALASSPRFIVADEPVSALDVSVQAQVINLLGDLTRQENLTMVFISHDLGVVRHVATRVAVMYLGQIVEIADRDDFFAGPEHPYSEALLSAVPALRGDPSEVVRERIVLRGELPNPAAPPAGCRFNTRCAYATDLCLTETPALREITEGRMVRCHFPASDPDGRAVAAVDRDEDPIEHTAISSPTKEIA